MTTEKDRFMDIEWRLWRDLCGRLKEAGLVTQADLSAPVSENRTAGQKLIHAITAWGENRTNEIATLTANKLIAGNEYVLTAVREWGSARRRLNALVDAEG